jgi:hypothetical protein
MIISWKFSIHTHSQHRELIILRKHEKQKVPNNLH